MSNIRQARQDDVSRLAEIEIFNYRLNFYPIFKNDWYYFNELSILDEINKYHCNENIIHNTYVYDDGVVKGFIRIDGDEVKKLFVEPVLQGQSIGAKLLEYGIKHHNVTFLWALEKNKKAISFYERNGFYITNNKKYEDGTTEYLVRLVR